MKATLKDGQSLWDIALLATGATEAVFEVAAANNVSLDDDMAIGTELDIPAIANRDIVTHYTVNKLAPATGMGNTGGETALLEDGIEFWTIEYDFVVS